MTNVKIYVDNVRGNDSPGRGIIMGTQEHPVRTADKAFSLLPPTWDGSAEIIFALTEHPEYSIEATSVSFGTPIGPDASPLVIRGGYTNVLSNVEALGPSNGDYVRTTTALPPEDELIGKVLQRVNADDSPVGPAVSIRGITIGPEAKILLQGKMEGIRANDRFVVQGPAVTLVPDPPPHAPAPLVRNQALNVTSHDGRSVNLTLIGIRIAPEVGRGLNLLNVRAQCDTCEFSFEKYGDTSTTLYVHTNSRIIGGIEIADLSPDLPPRRAQAGVYIHSDNSSNIAWAVRNGVLSGHLTFDKVTVRASQGGVFVPKSLEMRESPLEILSGGMALAEKEGWGSRSNPARIRNAGRHGLHVSNGSINSSLNPINLDIFGCGGDGIRLDMCSTASFGRPHGGDTGLVTSGAPNAGFGMNVRNASRAIVGADTALNRGVANREVALDDGAIESDLATWAAITPNSPLRNAGMSLVRRVVGSAVPS